MVFINERPQTRPFRLSVHVCITCDRPLQDPYHFCSLSCKVKQIYSFFSILCSVYLDLDTSIHVNSWSIWSEARAELGAIYTTVIFFHSVRWKTAPTYLRLIAPVEVGVLATYRKWLWERRDLLLSVAQILQLLRCRLLLRLRQEG